MSAYPSCFSCLFNGIEDYWGRGVLNLYLTAMPLQCQETNALTLGNHH